MPFQATAVQRKLEDAGFDKRQAYAITEVLESNVVEDLEQRLVTKDYLDARLSELRGELRTDIAAFKSELKSEIAGSRSEFKSEIGSLRSEIKSEVSTLRAEFKGERLTLRSELRDEMSAFRFEILKWTFAMVSASTIAIILAMVRLAK